ncbi:hypothetical protein [Streptomyces sp. NPDC048256]|uniref:hypothetical protein n=1 Tax=unclassified Streptomyces TaxID=2593676 RepID=UPI0033EA5E79
MLTRALEMTAARMSGRQVGRWRAGHRSLMTALRPPTRAVQDPSTGNWVPGHNPGRGPRGVMTRWA